MSVPYDEIRQELDCLEGMTLEDYAREVAELRIENEALKASLANKSLEGGELVTVYRDSLDDLIRAFDCHCRHCPTSMNSGECENRLNCEKAMIRFLSHDWDGLRKTVKSEDYL